MEPIKLIPLHVGRAEVWASGAENHSVHLTYDVSNYLKAWPDAQPSVAFERADGETYAHAWEMDGPVLHVPLLLADTEIPGMCKCMITMLSGDGRANTVVFYGSVTEGIDSLGAAPTEPMLGIIEQVNAAVVRAETAADRAEGAGGSGGAVDQVQADWNENDPTSKAYVKNRTHWVDTSFVDVMPETTFTADTLTENGWPVFNPLNNLPAAGKMCTVVWNGTAYECPVQAYSMDDGVQVSFIGDGSNIGIAGNGEPFAILALPTALGAELGYYAAVMPLDGSTTATVAIRAESETVHPLDPKYLGAVRGQKKIIITIKEDGSITADTPFSEAWALDEGALQAALCVQHSFTSTNDRTVVSTHAAFAVSKRTMVEENAIQFSVESYQDTMSRVTHVYNWFSFGVILEELSYYSLPGSHKTTIWPEGSYVKQGAGGTVEARAIPDVKIDLGISALAAENAGTLLYIDANGNAQPLTLGEGLSIVDGVLTIDAKLARAVAGMALAGQVNVGEV